MILYKIKSTVMGLLLASASVLQAQNPVDANDDAYSMGVYYAQRGFQMLPSIDGVDGTGAKISFLVPVTKGIDYTFLAGRDKYIKDLDIFVYDENNGLILNDRRSKSRAGVRFRSSYTGTVKVILWVARSNGLGAWSVIVGRRGGGERMSPVDANAAPAKN